MNVVSSVHVNFKTGTYEKPFTNYYRLHNTF